MSTPESKGSPAPWHWGTAGWGWLEDANGDPVLERDPYNDGYPKCSDANRALIAKAPEMAAMLRELEGVANEEYGRIQCPVCDSMWDHSDTATYHKPDCRLNALLRSLEPK